MTSPISFSRRATLLLIALSLVASFISAPPAQAEEPSDAAPKNESAPAQGEGGQNGDNNSPGEGSPPENKDAPDGGGDPSGGNGPNPDREEQDRPPPKENNSPLEEGKGDTPPENKDTPNRGGPNENDPSGGNGPDPDLAEQDQPPEENNSPPNENGPPPNQDAPGKDDKPPTDSLKPDPPLDEDPTSPEGGTPPPEESTTPPGEETTPPGEETTPPGEETTPATTPSEDADSRIGIASHEDFEAKCEQGDNNGDGICDPPPGACDTDSFTTEVPDCPDPTTKPPGERFLGCPTRGIDDTDAAPNTDCYFVEGVDENNDGTVESVEICDYPSGTCKIFDIKDAFADNGGVFSFDALGFWNSLLGEGSHPPEGGENPGSGKGGTASGRGDPASGNGDPASGGETPSENDEGDDPAEGSEDGRGIGDRLKDVADRLGAPLGRLLGGGDPGGNPLFAPLDRLTGGVLDRLFGEGGALTSRTASASPGTSSSGPDGSSRLRSSEANTLSRSATSIGVTELPDTGGSLLLPVGVMLLGGGVLVLAGARRIR